MSDDSDQSPIQVTQAFGSLLKNVIKRNWEHNAEIKYALGNVHKKFFK